MGQLAYRLSRRGIPPAMAAAGSMALFMLVQLALLSKVGPPLPLWILFGFFGTSGMLNYAILDVELRDSVANFSAGPVGAGEHRAELAGVRAGFRWPVGYGRDH